jgi:molecular chaperone GrpE
MLKFDQDPKVKNIVFGVDMVKKQFSDVLLKNGLSEVKTEGVFDPNFHEAMGQVEAEGKTSGQIVSVQQKGYILNGRLTRAAKVTVAK